MDRAASHPVWHFHRSFPFSGAGKKKAGVEGRLVPARVFADRQRLHPQSEDAQSGRQHRTAGAAAAPGAVVRVGSKTALDELFTCSVLLFRDFLLIAIQHSIPARFCQARSAMHNAKATRRPVGTRKDPDRLGSYRMRAQKVIPTLKRYFTSVLLRPSAGVAS